MTLNRYTDIGFDGVLIDGPDMLREENGEEILRVRAIGLLHQKIAEALVTRPFALAGGELRFLRTEIGEDPETFAATLGVAPDSFRTAERDGRSLDPADEERLRRLAAERLGLPVAADRLVLREDRPEDLPAIVIDAVGERDYAIRVLDQGSEAVAPSSAPQIPSPLEVARHGLRLLLAGLGPMPVLAEQRAYRNSDRSGDEATVETALRARVPDDAPADLLWAPVAAGQPEPGTTALIFQWRGTGPAVTPQVTLRLDSAPAEPAEVTLDPEDGGLLSVLLPPLGSASRHIGVLTPDAERLIVMLEKVGEAGGSTDGQG